MTQYFLDVALGAESLLGVFVKDLEDEVLSLRGKLHLF